jgi:hypothetical protein
VLHRRAAAMKTLDEQRTSFSSTEQSGHRISVLNFDMMESFKSPLQR